MEYDAERLIYLVQNRPPIYNTTLKEHNNRNTLEKLWNEIGEEMKCGVYECKQQWTTLRNTYARALRLEISEKTESASKKRKRWYLADTLSFLSPYMKNSTVGKTSSTYRSESLASASIDQDTTFSNEEVKQSDESLPLSSLLESPYVSPPKSLKRKKAYDKVGEPMVRFPKAQSDESLQLPLPSPSEYSYVSQPKSLRRKKGMTTDDNVLEPMIRFLKTRTYNNEDPNKHFLISLLPDLNKLTPRNQRAFKVEMLNKLNHYLDMQEFGTPPESLC